mmetsp:Transcript_36213/g.65205  ORF Transcript_36213/g.65205 Transcript_36213/m.65205 type:complete len:480 (-) Transcript_36213:81-1520(-)
MLVKISFLLMTLLIKGVPSTFGFQSRSPNENFSPRYQSPSTLPTTNFIQPRYNEERGMRTPTSVSYSSSQGPQGQEWINKSVEYYTKVMRVEGRPLSASNRDEQSRIAKRLYHAIQQVRSGNLNRAEHIYRKTIQDINNEDGCHNAELATTTLLLALVLQRMDNIGEARMVFHRFFRTAMSTTEKDPFHECACTGKVLGAYALFEMRFGSVHRSIEVARRAMQFDGKLSKLFDWKQFRDAKQKISPSLRKDHNHNATPCSFVAEVNLPADAGDFRLRAYRSSRDASNNEHPKFTGTEPSVIYYAAKPPFGANGKSLNDVPIRVHSSCVKCEIFGNERCKCKDQLELSMEYIQKHGGAIVYFQPEGRSTSIAHGVAASVLHNSGIETIDTNLQTGVDADYSAIPSILDDMGIESIRLIISNNPTMVRRLRDLGLDVRGSVPLAVRSSIDQKDRRRVGVAGICKTGISSLEVKTNLGTLAP